MGLPELISKETIYDDTGYVDCLFMTEVLIFLKDWTAFTIDIELALSGLLGVTEFDKQPQKRQKKEERKMTAEEVLKLCVFSDNVLRLPNMQLQADTYNDVKRRIMEAGGKWSGGKVQGFTFGFDASRVVTLLMEKGRCNLKKDFQYFATPDALSDRIVALADIRKEHSILEPSAGDGSIIRAVRRKVPEAQIDCYELMPENRELLSAVDGCRCIGEDFLNDTGGRYDRIVANPPFSNNQDVRHVLHMYDRLNEGGRIVSVMSRHWRDAKEKECADFRDFIIRTGAEVYLVDEGAFHESGTNICTVIVVITRRP